MLKGELGKVLNCLVLEVEREKRVEEFLVQKLVVLGKLLIWSPHEKEGLWIFVSALPAWFD